VEDDGEAGSLDCVIASNEVPDSIEVVPAEAKIKSDRTGQYAAIATWRNGACYTDVTASSLLEWSSADEDICTIDDQGVAIPTGKKKDQTEITAVYDGSVELTDEASCEVD
jgi:hypothetical protein